MSLMIHSPSIFCSTVCIEEIIFLISCNIIALSSSILFKLFSYLLLKEVIARFSITAVRGYIISLVTINFFCQFSHSIKELFFSFIFHNIYPVFFSINLNEIRNSTHIHVLQEKTSIYSEFPVVVCYLALHSNVVPVHNNFSSLRALENMPNFRSGACFTTI